MNFSNVKRSESTFKQNEVKNIGKSDAEENIKATEITQKHNENPNETQSKYGFKPKPEKDSNFRQSITLVKSNDNNICSQDRNGVRNSGGERNEVIIPGKLLKEVIKRAKEYEEIKGKNEELNAQINKVIPQLKTAIELCKILVEALTPERGENGFRNQMENYRHNFEITLRGIYTLTENQLKKLPPHTILAVLDVLAKNFDLYTTGVNNKINDINNKVYSLLGDSREIIETAQDKGSLEATLADLIKQLNFASDLSDKLEEKNKELEKKNKELEKKNKELEADNERLKEEYDRVVYTNCILTAANTRLDQANKSPKKEFAVIDHQLNNPQNNINPGHALNKNAES